MHSVMTLISFQAFRLCRSGNFNLSHESITSPEALRALREIQQNNPDKWSKIALHKSDADPSLPNDEEINKDLEESPFEDELDDDSAITVPELVAGIAANAAGARITNHTAIALKAIWS